MTTIPLFTGLRAACVLTAAIGLSLSAQAEEHERASRSPQLPAYKAECGACHVAFPVGLLPASSWQHLMNNLPRHFGSDASLDPATHQTLSTWLASQAGGGRRQREAPPEDRITRSAWFVREHDEVSAATWKRPAVKSPANCVACHVQAEQGDFSEHNIRIPR